jgi:hypothetical protein
VAWLAFAGAGCGTARDPYGLVPPSVPAGGWTITVYYTAVERFHTGAPTAVTGCRKLDCANGTDNLGTFAKDFVQAVKDEGTGATADGRYLNWSYDTGYWLDSAARDTHGDPLRPYVSAAADPSVIKGGAGFVVADCGRQDDGSPPPAQVCQQLRSAHWQVVDEFTPGLGGERHVDLYIGPETGPGFTDSDWYVTLSGATLRVQQPT